MNLFKKKKEEKRISKPLVIITEFFIAIVVFLCAIGLKWLVANKYNPKIIKLDDQTVEGITFSDFKVDYTDGKGKLTVNAINYTENPIIITKVTLRLYSKDNILISEIEVPNKVTLKTDEKYLISNEIATDTRVGKVEYKIGE